MDGFSARYQALSLDQQGVIFDDFKQCAKDACWRGVWSMDDETYALLLVCTPITAFCAAKAQMPISLFEYLLRLLSPEQLHDFLQYTILGL